MTNSLRKLSPLFQQARCYAAGAERFAARAGETIPSVKDNNKGPSGVMDVRIAAD